jgi:hypothetical protein
VAKSNVHIRSFKGLVDGHLLDLCHSLVSHTTRDFIDDVLMYQASISKFLELCDESGVFGFERRMILSLVDGDGRVVSSGDRSM